MTDKNISKTFTFNQVSTILAEETNKAVQEISKDKKEITPFLILLFAAFSGSILARLFGEEKPTKESDNAKGNA